MHQIVCMPLQFFYDAHPEEKEKEFCYRLSLTHIIHTSDAIWCRP